jgi:hypothetical protein
MPMYFPFALLGRNHLAQAWSIRLRCDGHTMQRKFVTAYRARLLRRPSAVLLCFPQSLADRFSEIDDGLAPSRVKQPNVL